MASSLSNLVLDIAAEDSVRAAAKILAPIGKFAHSFAAAENEKGNVVKVPVFASGAAYDFGSSNNYTSAEAAGVDGKNIELNKHKWASKRLLPDDDMETAAGKDWATQIAISSVEAVAKALCDDVLTDLCTKGTGTISLSGLSTATKKVAAARKAVAAAGLDPSQFVCLVSTDIFSDLLEELKYDSLGRADAFENGYLDRLLGFARVAEVAAPQFTIGTGSDAVTYNLNIAAVAKDAVAVATRLPIVQNPDLYDVSDVSMPEVAPFSFRVRSTGANATDAKFLGAELIYGYQTLKPAEVYIAKTSVE